MVVRLQQKERDILVVEIVTLMIKIVIMMLDYDRISDKCSKLGCFREQKIKKMFDYTGE